MENSFSEYKTVFIFYCLQSTPTEWPLLSKLYFYPEEICASHFGDSIFICTIGHELTWNGHCFQKGWTWNPLYLGTSQVSTVTPLK